MRRINQVDLAPTVAKILGVKIPGMDGAPIEEVESWGCSKAIVLIVDSLGYDLYKFFQADLKNMASLASGGLLVRAKAAATHTSPAIASILSGLLPEHHGIHNTEEAKASTLSSIPEIASFQGFKTAVIMEKGGAEVYEGLIDFVGKVSRDLDPREFDRETCRKSLEALAGRPELMISYFIGIDKAVHLGGGLEEMRSAAVCVDLCLGRIYAAAEVGTFFSVIGDHPVHAGSFKRQGGPCCVALVMGRK
jgi:hypothetical protein